MPDRKKANQKFKALMDKQVTHVRLGDKNARIRVIGSATDLHGLDGVCTCCPRRKVEA